MKRYWRGTVATVVAVLVSMGWLQQASAQTWGGKPAHTISVVRDPARISAIARGSAHPWALTDGGAGWFKSASGVARVKRAFHEFSAQNLQRYLDEGRVLDCADVALHNLADFFQQSGLRGAMKVYNRGAKYIDTADFSSGSEFTAFLLKNFGALHVIDNMRSVVRADSVRTPADLEPIQPGHARMLIHIARETTGRDRMGVPRMGHTQPISEVKIGETLADSRLVTIYGNYDAGQPLAVAKQTIWVESAISPRGLALDELFNDLGSVRTVAAPVHDYKKMLQGEARPVAEQALAMGWSIIEKGLGALGE